MKNFLILTLAITIFSCGNEKVNEPIAVEMNVKTITLNDKQIKNAGIETGVPEEKELSSVLTVNGKIDVPPQNLVSISVPMGGYLKSSHLLPGMKVRKGEVIAIIEDAQYIQLQQDYLSALAKFNFIEKDQNRQKELNDAQANSNKVFQQSESEYKIQKITVNSLYQKLKLTGIDPERLDENSISRSIKIYAPITGYVSAVNANIGKYLNPSDVLFELVNPDDIHLALTVFEKDVDKISIGQKVIAYNNQHPENKYEGEIILIGQNLSHEGSVEVHCHFEKYDPSLIPGMFMNADINTKTSNSLVLPEAAVVTYEGKQYVFVSKSHNTYEMLEIKTGVSENGFIEMPTLLNSNKVIVLKGAYPLLMALKNSSEE